MTGAASGRRALLVTGLAALASATGACASRPAATAPDSTPTATEVPTPTATPSAVATPMESSLEPASASPSPSRPASTAARASLAGDTRSAWAFAPLSNPATITVEGSVAAQKAWSTSKVLVVMALIATAGQGDPGRLSADQQRLVTLALTASDAAAIRTLKAAIPGDPATAMNAVLREIGDTTTKALSTYEGTMTWVIREQVRFMAAMAAGRVVSPGASSYVLNQLHPIASQRWGLAAVGASAVKGGWLRANTETRQMGILDGYAVAIISAVGAARLQSDGDYAHVDQMNNLAQLLKRRLSTGRS